MVGKPFDSVLETEDTGKGEGNTTMKPGIESQTTLLTGRQLFWKVEEILVHFDGDANWMLKRG